MNTDRARPRRFSGKLSPAIEYAPGERAASPIATPMRASASCVKLRATPHSIVMALQSATLAATIERRL